MAVPLQQYYIPANHVARVVRQLKVVARFTSCAQLQYFDNGAVLLQTVQLSGHVEIMFTNDRSAQKH